MIKNNFPPFEFEDGSQKYRISVKIESPERSEYYTFASKSFKGLMEHIAKNKKFKANKNQISFNIKP